MIRIPLQAVPFQFFNVILNGQACQLNIYEKTTGVFMDVYVSNQLIIGGVICQNLNRIVRDAYLGFVGDLAFYDTSNAGDDPSSIEFDSRFVLIYFDSTDLVNQAAAQEALFSSTAQTTPKQSIHVIVPGTVNRNTAFNVSVSFGLTPPPLSQLQYLNPVLGVPGSVPLAFPPSASIGGNVISFALQNNTSGAHSLQVIDSSTTPVTFSDVAVYTVVAGVDSVVIPIAPSIPTFATSINLWTPPATTPNTSVTLTGTFVGDPPTSLDYSIDNKVTWITASSANTGINQSTFTLSLTIPTGVSAGTYAASTVAVRDTNNHSAVGMIPGKWVVDSFSPTVPSAGTLIFATQVSNPAFTITDGSGHVVRLNDIGGSGRFLTVGPTTPPNNVTGSAFSGNNPVALKRGTGGDHGQTSLGMTTTTNSTIFDNNSNYFGAPPGGANDALIHMMDTADIRNNNWAVIFGVYLDVTKKYQGGPIWGAWNTPTTGIFITAGRWNGGSGTGPFTAEVDLAGAGGVNWFVPQTTISASGFHVFTAQQTGTTLRYRIDGGAWVSTTIAGTNAYASTQFSYGGSIIQNIGNINSGNSFAELFDMIAWTGTPSNADMVSGQKWIGNQAGISVS